MLKPMTWAKWIKKIMEILPIEKQSQHIKDVLVAEILDAVYKRIPKTDLYTAAGCILSQEFCVEVHAEDAAIEPLPVSSPIIDKASDLLKPVKPKRVRKQKPSGEPELCETYDEIHKLGVGVVIQDPYVALSDEGISTPDVTKPKKSSKKKKTVVPVTSLADKASEIPSTEAEYDSFKSHMVEVMDGIQKNP